MTERRAAGGVGVAVAALAAAAALAVAAAAVAFGSPGSTTLLPAGFTKIDAGPHGGSVWQGPVPGPPRPTVVYLPPEASSTARYPVLYLLQGFRGSPYQYVDGLRLATVADDLIASRALTPFVVVIPPAGPDGRYDGEWTGVWEGEVVDHVVPWVDAHLPTQAGLRARAIAGLSAGGYGAVDIALRHPQLFGTVESWSGYFDPIRDGTLAHVGGAALRAHDPTLLVRGEAPLLRKLGVRFFLSSGTTTDRVTAARTRAFAAELAALRLPYRLWLGPGGHDGKLWRAQLPSALRYAFAPGG